jgi:hypothetical protein
MTKGTIKYLGIVLDNARRYFLHLEQVCRKAEAFVGVMRNLLPNVNGPTGPVRKLYYGVLETVILYGAPIRASALIFERNRKIFKRAQRAALLCTSTAYRIVSHAALCVVTGSMPIDIKARQREKKYAYKKSLAALDGHDTQGTQVKSPSEVGRCRFNQEAENCRRMEWAYYNSTNCRLFHLVG